MTFVQLLNYELAQQIIIHPFIRSNGNSIMPFNSSERQPLACCAPIVYRALQIKELSKLDIIDS